MVQDYCTTGSLTWLAICPLTASWEWSSWNMFMAKRLLLLRMVSEVRDTLERIIDSLHRKGFVFGDFRMPKIMVQNDGKVQLIDFWLGGERWWCPIPTRDFNLFQMAIWCSRTDTYSTRTWSSDVEENDGRSRYGDCCLIEAQQIGTAIRLTWVGKYNTACRNQVKSWEPWPILTSVNSSLAPWVKWSIWQGRSWVCKLSLSFIRALLRMPRPWLLCVAFFLQFPLVYSARFMSSWLLVRAPATAEGGKKVLHDFYKSGVMTVWKVTG